MKIHNPIKNITGKSVPVISILFLFIFSLWPGSSRAVPSAPEGSFVGVCSAIVYDMDHDAILFEQNADQPIPPASLTKIMSMFLAMDFIRDGHAKMDSLVPVSRDAAYAGGSSMGIKPGEEITFQNLLKGMAVSSGNDASYAIAEYVGGSANSFVKMMNIKAAQLGMLDTRFYNPHGLPAEGQQTTARDMLTLARAYLKAYPQMLEFHNTRTLTHRGYTSWNKNPLLGQYPGADGLKSGWVRASGYNLVFTATRDNRRLLAVILGAPDSGTRGAEACRLLDAGFMVCGNTAVSVAAALDNLPYDETRIDPKKTAKDAGIYRARSYAFNSSGKSLSDKRKKIKSLKAKSLALQKASNKDKKLQRQKNRKISTKEKNKQLKANLSAKSKKASVETSKTKKKAHTAHRTQKFRAHSG